MKRRPPHIIRLNRLAADKTADPKLRARADLALSRQPRPKEPKPPQAPGLTAERAADLEAHVGSINTAWYPLAPPSWREIMASGFEAREVLDYCRGRYDAALIRP
jgi:hypothetical protein